MQGNELNKFPTIVSEVSSFVGNPVLSFNLWFSVYVNAQSYIMNPLTDLPKILIRELSRATKMVLALFKRSKLSKKTFKEKHSSKAGFPSQYIVRYTISLCLEAQNTAILGMFLVRQGFQVLNILDLVVQGRSLSFLNLLEKRYSIL